MDAEIKNDPRTNPHHEVHYPGIALTYHYTTFYRKINSDHQKTDSIINQETFKWQRNHVSLRRLCRPGAFADADSLRAG